MPFFNYQRTGLIGGAYPEDYFNAGMKSLHDYSSPDIIRNNLQLYVDAANLNSYPGTGTTWTDLSGNGRNGTLTNGPTFSSDNGGYIQCDGSNDVITFGQNFNFTTLGFTIGAWVNILTLSATGGANPNFFWKGEFNVSGYYCEFNPTSSGQVRFFTNQSGASQSTTSLPNTLNYVNRWTHIVIVKNEKVSPATTAAAAIYVDGQDVTSTVGAHIDPASASGNNFQISRYSSTGNISNVRYGSFYIWQGALTAAQVLKMYNAGRKRFGV